jgi:hypothetical protein
MKLSTKRLGSFVAAAAVAAILAGLATTAAFAKKPQGKRPKALTIEATILDTAYGPFGDTFTAKGAVKDSGDLFIDHYWNWVFTGKQGTMYVDVWEGGFEVLDGSGPYADFVGAIGELKSQYDWYGPLELEEEVFGVWYDTLKVFPSN